MSKRDQVKYVRKATPVKTFLANWGVFLSLLIAAQAGGHVVIYPKPVALVDASREDDGGWLTSITR
jgi:hypothetical protein